MDMGAEHGDEDGDEHGYEDGDEHGDMGEMRESSWLVTPRCDLSLHGVPKPPQGGRFVLTNQISISATVQHKSPIQCAPEYNAVNIECARPCSESQID